MIATGSSPTTSITRSPAPSAENGSVCEACNSSALWSSCTRHAGNPHRTQERRTALLPQPIIRSSRMASKSVSRTYVRHNTCGVGKPRGLQGDRCAQLALAANSDGPFSIFGQTSGLYRPLESKYAIRRVQRRNAITCIHRLEISFPRAVRCHLNSSQDGQFSRYSNIIQLEQQEIDALRQVGR